ncbi:hypothetical protein GCM10007874_54880 [Labrys miyagiensis]|uniref:Uncharacterized protein n=1 Tax=Labrys miyagiensis TaxID=346912 RepID=A0ABQ6CRN3_9HYPH|nr:hypothetical protein GCM10007874_54880 [Labrys miyagiensis]
MALLDGVADIDLAGNDAPTDLEAEIGAIARIDATDERPEHRRILGMRDDGEYRAHRLLREGGKRGSEQG